MRLLVVSRSPMMAMTLRAENFDVLDLRPPRFAEWLASDGEDVDALVLDLADPRLALQAVVELRAKARMAPALLVSSDEQGWDELAVRDLPAAEVLPLPVTRPALLSALSSLIAGQQQVLPQGADEAGPTRQESSEPPTDLDDDLRGTAVIDRDSPPAAGKPTTPSPPAPVEHTAVHDDVSPPPPSADTLPTVAMSAPAFPADASAVSAVAVELATHTPSQFTPLAPPRKPAAGEEAAGVATAKPECEEHQPAGVPHEAVPEHAGEADAPQSPEVVHDPIPAATAHGLQRDTVHLVQLLHERVGELVSVADVADVVIADAVERVRAEAGALLVPDRRRWRVSGGVGLRALEHRLELEEDSWVVTEVAEAGQGVLVEDSDIARNPLKGMPLASWHHILLAPVPLVDAILVLARAEVPFEESDLSTLVELNKEAGPLLRAALQTRALARALAEFADQNGG